MDTSKFTEQLEQDVEALEAWLKEKFQDETYRNLVLKRAQGRS